MWWHGHCWTAAKSGGRREGYGLCKYGDLFCDLFESLDMDCFCFILIVHFAISGFVCALLHLVSLSLMSSPAMWLHSGDTPLCTRLHAAVIRPLLNCYWMGGPTLRPWPTWVQRLVLHMDCLSMQYYINKFGRLFIMLHCICVSLKCSTSNRADGPPCIGLHAMATRPLLNCCSIGGLT